MAPFLIDDGTLLVHHIIVFEQVLTDTEVVLLDLLLCAFDALRYQWRLDTLSVLESHAVHPPCYLLRAEQTHELVLQ